GSPNRGATARPTRGQEAGSSCTSIYHACALRDHSSRAPQNAAAPDNVPVLDSQREELRRRVEEHRSDPSSVTSWEQVLTEARAR
ncbi:MAG: addiction module protein, partial [Polyangiaceae bacterium]